MPLRRTVPLGAAAGQMDAFFPSHGGWALSVHRSGWALSVHTREYPRARACTHPPHLPDLPSHMLPPPSPATPPPPLAAGVATAWRARWQVCSCAGVAARPARATRRTCAPR
eukprot:366529-Chlamydomonas_euryale.AAC.1